MSGSRRSDGPKSSALVGIPGGVGGRKYDEAEFLVGGRGVGPGETEKQSFKLHEGYIAEVDLLVKSGMFPYTTYSDLYRHAVVRHVHWLKSLEPEEVQGSVLHQVTQIDELVAAEEFQIRFTKNIEATAKMVRSIIKMPNGKDHAGTVLRRIRRKIDRMRDGFWKSYYERLFMDEFGSYLRDGLILLQINGEEEDGGGEMGWSEPDIEDEE